jgi:hypothetical protein
MYMLIVVWDDVLVSYPVTVLNVLQLGCVRATTYRNTNAFSVVCIPSWNYLLYSVKLERLLRKSETPV